MSTERRFYCTLDGIRGIAALLILMRHSVFIFEPFEFTESYLAVDLFFVLSGVVISQAYGKKLHDGYSIYKFIGLRLIRIYPLYIVATLIGFCDFMVTKTGFPSGNYHIYDVLVALALSIFFIPNPGIGPDGFFPFNGPSWSLFFELVANAIFAGSILYLSNNMLRIILISFSLLLAACIIFSPEHNLTGGGAIGEAYIGFTRVTFSFFAGVYIHRIYANSNLIISNVKLNFLIPYFLILIVIVILTAHIESGSTAAAIFDFITTVFLFPPIVYAGLIFQPIGIGAEIFKFAGFISYSLYILHAPIVHLIYGIVEKIFKIVPSAYAPLSGFVFVMILVPICFLSEYLYDMPVRRYLTSRRWFKESTSSARIEGVARKS